MISARLLPPCLALALALPAVAQAQEASAPAPVLPAAESPPPSQGAVITGLRLPRPLRDVPPVVTVIPRKEIEHSAALTADDLVRAVPSVATFRRSSSLTADPTSQGLNLRGLGPSGVSRALVLEDGIPLNDPFGGWVYWRSIPLLGIDRVEIQPSGASALYGNFALGGVAQVVSRPITATGVEAMASAGSRWTEHGAVRGTVRTEKVGAAVTVDALRTSGFIPVSEADRGAVDGPAPSRDINARGVVELQARPDLLVRFSGGYFGSSLEAGTPYTTADVRSGNFAGTVHWQDPGGGSALDVSVFAGLQHFEQGRARIGAGRSTAAPASSQVVPSNDQGAAITWTSAPLQAGGEHVLLAGLDVLRVEGTSNESLTPPNPGPTSTVSRVTGGEQRLGGVFLQDAVRVTDAVDLTAGLRLDGWQNRAGERTLTQQDGTATPSSFPDRSGVQLDPRLAVLVRATPLLTLRASGYRAFRAPTLNELYRPFQVGTVLTEANEDLVPETLWGAEAGAEVAVRGFTARTTGFWNELDQPVSNVTLATPLPDGATKQRQNLGHARVRGVELEADWRLSRRWSALASYTFVDPIVTSAPGNDDLVGLELAQDPRHRFTAAVTFDDPAIVTATAQVRVVGAQFEDDRNTLPMDAFAVVDVSASRAIGHGFSVFATASNLFDTVYLVGRSGVDTIGEPLNVQVGLKFDSMGL
jgi:outer membrane receptor protein involved in Fe transport